MNNMATCDSQVVAKVNPHEHFARDGADLRGELNISVIEALSGFNREVHLLNGSMISLNKTGVSEELLNQPIKWYLHSWWLLRC